MERFSYADFLKLFWLTSAKFMSSLFFSGCKAAFPHKRWEVASYLCDLDHSRWCLGSFPRWSQEGKWRESGSISSHQATGPADPRSRAGKHNTHLPQMFSRRQQILVQTINKLQLENLFATYSLCKGCLGLIKGRRII